MNTLTGERKCGCESSQCGHAYGAAAAGARVAMYVGAVCDACADSHMAPYLLAHAYVITTDGRHGYPYRARCVCGWSSTTYAARHAAQAMADDHMAQVGKP